MANKKAVNVIVSPTQFAHIHYYTTVKQAWDKLRILHKGDKQVRDLKLQMTLLNFEYLRMLESKTFSAFYENVKKLMSEALGLGKPIYVKQQLFKIS